MEIEIEEPDRDLALALFCELIEQIGAKATDPESVALYLWRSVARNLAVRGRGKWELVGHILEDEQIAPDVIVRGAAK